MHYISWRADFPLQRYNSGRYRFTDIALQRNFDVAAASRRAMELGLPVELIDTAFAVHIKDRRVDKGTGLSRIAGRMKIDLSQFAAIGDSNSDLPMFRLAGFRACVGNASPAAEADLRLCGRGQIRRWLCRDNRLYDQPEDALNTHGSVPLLRPLHLAEQPGPVALADYPPAQSLFGKSARRRAEGIDGQVVGQLF